VDLSPRLARLRMVRWQRPQRRAAWVRDRLRHTRTQLKREGGKLARQSGGSVSRAGTGGRAHPSTESTDSRLSSEGRFFFLHCLTVGPRTPLAASTWSYVICNLAISEKTNFTCGETRSGMVTVRRVVISRKRLVAR
jgi:hypothetical protein